MTTFKQFLNEQYDYIQFSATTPKGKKPHWEWDEENKRYLVYDSSGNVSSEHRYEFYYAASKAYYAAIAAVNKLKAEEHDKEHAKYMHFQQHVRPLTQYELEFIELDRKIRKYLRLIKDPNIDDETKAIYNEELEKLSPRWNKLADSKGVIRQSIISGEHEATRGR